MSVADFSWLFSKDPQRILSLLSCRAGEGRVVGGAVRNTLLGLSPDDFDIATTHTPQVVKEIFEAEGISVIPTGIEQGTVTALLNRIPYEITTLRKDVTTDGRWATVEFTDSWKEDASRRDFTMGALYVDAKGKIYDYFESIQDIKTRHVRFIGDPYARIQEDFLRILRFFRINAWYGAAPYNALSLQACIQWKASLSMISGERITKEILKLLKAQDPWEIIRILYKNNFFIHIFGEMHATPELFHALSNLEYKIKIKAPFLIRLKALHAGAFPRLKLSKVQKKLLATLDRPCVFFEEDPLEMALKKALYQYPWEWIEGTLWLSASAQLVKNTEALDHIVEKLRYALEYIRSYQLASFPVTGHDAMEFGLKGEEIGGWLAYIKSWWVEQNCTPSREVCLKHLEQCIQK